MLKLSSNPSPQGISILNISVIFFSSGSLSKCKWYAYVSISRFIKLTYLFYFFSWLNDILDSLFSLFIDIRLYIMTCPYVRWSICVSPPFPLLPTPVSCTITFILLSFKILCHTAVAFCGCQLIESMYRLSIEDRCTLGTSHCTFHSIRIFIL